MVIKLQPLGLLHDCGAFRAAGKNPAALNLKVKTNQGLMTRIGAHCSKKEYITYNIYFPEML